MSGKAIDFAVLLLISLALLSQNFADAADSTNFPTSAQKVEAKHVKEMFDWTYQQYLQYAFPKDELKPISCDGHDTLGSYSLTLFDALDALLVFGNVSEFKRVTSLICDGVDFDLDRGVSVFETNIRVLGALVSGHMLAIDERFGALQQFPEYNGCLLEKAKDMGERLLAAYDTPTGIPYGSVNLRHGASEDVSKQI